MGLAFVFEHNPGWVEGGGRPDLVENKFRPTEEMDIQKEIDSCYTKKFHVSSTQV